MSPMVRYMRYSSASETDPYPVDICITTEMKALEKTCLLAEALAERGYNL